MALQRVPEEEAGAFAFAFADSPNRTKSSDSLKLDRQGMADEDLVPIARLRKIHTSPPAGERAFRNHL